MAMSASGSRMPGELTTSAEPDEAHPVIRGGAWDYMPRLLRSAWRDFAAPDTKRDNLGFRIACDL